MFLKVWRPPQVQKQRKPCSRDHSVCSTIVRSLQTAISSIFQNASPPEQAYFAHTYRLQNIHLGWWPWDGASVEAQGSGWSLNGSWAKLGVIGPTSSGRDSDLTVFCNSVKTLDLKNIWNLPIFVMFPGKSRQVGKKKYVQIIRLCNCNLYCNYNTFGTLQSRDGTRNGLLCRCFFHCWWTYHECLPATMLLHNMRWKVNVWWIPRIFKVLDLLIQERHPPSRTDTEDFPWLLPLRERDSMSHVTRWAARGLSYTCPTL